MTEVVPQTLPADEPNWRRTLPSASVIEGKPACAFVGTTKIALVRFNGTVYALNNRCTHAAGPLCGGKVVEGSLACPWHDARYDILTGEPTQLPARLGVATYKTREQDGFVEVALPS